MPKHPFMKAVAVGLVVPVFLEHKPHIDIAYAVTETLPLSPFNVVSTATAGALLSLWSEWKVLRDFE